MRACAWLLLLVSLSWSGASGAAGSKLAGRKLAVRPSVLEIDRGWLAMTVGYRDVVDAAIRKKLSSGLPTVIVSRAYVFADGSQTPIGLGVKTCRVVYDLWDEVFRVEVRRGGLYRRTVVVNVEGVLRRCAAAHRLPIVGTKLLAADKSYFIGVLVEVNPLSKQTLERLKRWVALPKGAGVLGPGDSLFGSFVGLFITHLPNADRTLAFRTRSFVPRSLPVVKHPPKKKPAT